MTPTRYIEGMASALVVGGSLWVATGAILVRFLPSWRGGPARLARLVLGIGLLTVVAELLGTVGLFHLLPLVAVTGVIGLIAWGTSRHPRAVVATADVDDPPIPPAGRSEGRWERVGALGSVALVAGEWGPGVLFAFRNGVANIDSLWYHMPFAARFAQSGSVLALHNINNDNVIAFYPAMSEVTHASGIVLMGTDILSPVLNVAWLALALFAAWCLGARFGVGSLALMGTAVVAGTTELVADEPGSAYNDIVGIALVLSAVALVAWALPVRNRRPDTGGLLVAALAAGLALGVKYTFIFPVLALTVGAIALVPRGRRVRSGAAWLAVVIVGGGLWYARNFAEAGNPVPNVRVDIGGIHLPTPMSAPAPTVWHVLFSRGVWTADIRPGLSQAFGPGWWLLSAVAAFGLVAGLLAGSSRLWPALVGVAPPAGKGASTGTADPSPTASTIARLVAFVGIATVAGYLFTPEPNLPVSFVYDLRFVALAVVAGVIALALLVANTRWVNALLVVLAVLAIATQFAKGIWWGSPSLVYYHSLGTGLLVGATVLVVGGLRMEAGRAQWSAHRLAAWVAVAGVVLTVLCGGFFVERFYLAHRYLSGPQAPIVRWANSVHRAPIGVSDLTLSYPLYGPDLTNEVVYIGIPEPHGAFSPILNCQQWRRAVNGGHFAYVVSDEPYYPNDPRSTAYWTGTDPEARSVVKALVPSAVGADFIDVFKINGRLDPSRC